MAITLTSDCNLDLTATGSTQASAFRVSSAVNHFTTVAAGTGCVLGFVRGGGTYPNVLIEVVNDGANNLTVYPPAGAQIGASGVNAGVSIVPGGAARFLSVSPTYVRTL